MLWKKKKIMVKEVYKCQMDQKLMAGVWNSKSTRV